MNRADYETARLTKLGNQSAALRKRGICTHGWLQGPPGTPGDVVYLHCATRFPDMDAAHRAGKDAFKHAE